jgi:hypothetical protein
MRAGAHMPAARPRRRTEAVVHGKAAQRTYRRDKALRAHGEDGGGSCKKKIPSLA